MVWEPMLLFLAILPFTLVLPLIAMALLGKKRTLIRNALSGQCPDSYNECIQYQSGGAS